MPPPQSTNKNSDCEASDNSCASSQSSKRKGDPITPPPQKTRHGKSAKSAKATKKIMPPEDQLTQTKLDNLIAQVTHTSQQNTIIMESLQRQNESLEALKADVAAIKTSRNADAKKLAKVDKELNQLKSKVESLAAENNQLHQHALERDIVVFGLPPLRRDQLPELVSSLATHTNTQLSPADFSHIYCTTRRDKTKSTLHARFHCNQKKTEFLNSIKEKKKNNIPILLEDLLQLGPNDPRRGSEIVAKPKLTAANQQIFNEARKHKDKFKFVWQSEGRLLIRQSEASPIMEIVSMNQLMELLNPTQRNRTRSEDDDGDNDSEQISNHD